jgi:hypothetical protein
LDSNLILPIYEKIYQAYSAIPSREIWTDHTIDATIRLLGYYFETGKFENKDTVLFLLDRLSSLVESIKQNADNSCKGDRKGIPFGLYYCAVNLENNFMLLSKGDQIMCIMQLYAINRIITDNELLCTETKKWVDSLISKSILISGEGAFRERFSYFQTAKDKIQALIKKIVA